VRPGQVSGGLDTALGAGQEDVPVTDPNHWPHRGVVDEHDAGPCLYPQRRTAVVTSELPHQQSAADARPTPPGPATRATRPEGHASRAGRRAMTRTDRPPRQRQNPPASGDGLAG
jgi:hypothetical protein